MRQHFKDLKRFAEERHAALKKMLKLPDSPSSSALKSRGAMDAYSLIANKIGDILLKTDACPTCDPCSDCRGNSQNTHRCCSCYGTGINPSILAEEGYNPYEGL